MIRNSPKRAPDGQPEFQMQIHLDQPATVHNLRVYQGCHICSNPVSAGFVSNLSTGTELLQTTRWSGLTCG